MLPVMKNRRAILLAFVLLTFSMIVTVTVSAAAQESESEAGTASTASDGTYKMPAVSVIDGVPDVVVEPWTTKFLIPTSIVLAVVAVFTTVVQYFVKVVRNRYKVVE